MDGSKHVPKATKLKKKWKLGHFFLDKGEYCPQLSKSKREENKDGIRLCYQASRLSKLKLLAGGVC